MGPAPYGVVTPSQTFSWEISRLVVAVAIFDCNVIPSFTTARDDEKRLKSEWHGDGNSDGFDSTSCQIPATSCPSATGGFRSRPKAQGPARPHGAQPPVSVAGWPVFLGASR